MEDEFALVWDRITHWEMGEKRKSSLLSGEEDKKKKPKPPPIPDEETDYLAMYGGDRLVVVNIVCGGPSVQRFGPPSVLRFGSHTFFADRPSTQRPYDRQPVVDWPTQDDIIRLVAPMHQGKRARLSWWFRLVAANPQFDSATVAGRKSLYEVALAQVEGRPPVVDIAAPVAAPVSSFGSPPLSPPTVSPIVTPPLSPVWLPSQTDSPHQPLVESHNQPSTAQGSAPSFPPLPPLGRPSSSAAEGLSSQTQFG